MKADRAALKRALLAPASLRFFLLHGPDDAASRALANQIGVSLGGQAERIDLTDAMLRTDPARLADEAAAISLFGTPRFIVVAVAGAGDDCVPAVTALVDAPAAGNPVAIVAGALRPTSRLLKLALAHPDALAFASFAPEGRDATRLIVDLARPLGLDVDADVAERLAAACAGNRAIVEQELGKLALYLDASPARPQTLDHHALDAIGTADGEGDLSRLLASVVSGNGAALPAELARLGTEGIEGITLIRAVLRRMLLLARMRADVDAGKSVAAVIGSQGRAIFWRDKSAIEAQLQKWRSPLLAKAIDRLSDAERATKAANGIGALAADEELFAICRQAARLR